LLKSHNCGELNKKHVGVKVALAGWVDRRRDHGGLIFIDLRDREGIVQVVFNPEISKQCHEIASEMRNEYVVRVSGEVAPRPPGTENLKLATGEIEVIAHNTAILNPSKTPPFYINEDVEVEESLRLKYRYLDLRRPRMKENLLLRHQVVKFIRDFLDAKRFIEVETPILIKSTPEGARDYLVPSRLHAGKFYALPQSPQQLKQLLMVAGVEKYFQIAKCFRDEDTRTDRQPEFTQLDLEMSFIDKEDILNLMQELFTSMVETIKPEMCLIKPFPRFSYAETMERYGTDKLGAKGLITIALGTSSGSLNDLTIEMVRSVVAKYLTLDQIKDMTKRLEAKLGDLLLIVAGKPDLVNMVLGELRQEMGRRLELADPNLLTFAFILNFPLLRWDEEARRWESEHHPFTAPWDEDVPLLDTAPETVRGKHYDVVCNGYEIGGGSIRIHTAELQRKMFRLLGYGDEEIDDRFGHMLEAFEYGAPPHGGIALGIDRIVMLLAGEETIREVIAFPKNQSAVDLTFNAPSSVTEDQLAELHLRLRDE